MKILENYIAKELIGMILLVAVALLGVDLFFYLINELKYIGKGSYGLTEALMFVLLTVPRKIYIMFPWSALLRTLLSLGNLAKNNELVAMRAAAVSINNISFAALKGAVLLTIAVLILGEVVAPVSEKIAQVNKTRALSSGQVIKTEFGVWIRNENEFVHVNNMINNDLHNIKKYKFDENLQLQEVISAKKAYITENDWKLEDIKGTRFDRNKINNFSLKSLVLEKLVDLNILETSQVKHLERLSIKHLVRIIKNRASNELSTNAYEVALWTKVFQPFAILVMVYIAIPFIFGPLRQASMGLKLLAGVFVGFSFHVVNSIFAQLPTVIELSPVIAIFLPPCIFFIIGYWMLSKVR